jgi:hypothetical protein
MILRENEQILEPSIEAAVSPKKQLESANRTILTADTGMLPTAALQACRLGLHFAAISFPVRRSAPRGITLSYFYLFARIEPSCPFDQERRQVRVEDAPIAYFVGIG